MGYLGVAGVTAAGAVLMLGGVIYGNVSVGDGCGSAFSPTVGGSESRSVSDCSALLGGRTDAAWEMLIGGGAVLAGAFTARLQSIAAETAAAEGKSPAVSTLQE